MKKQEKQLVLSKVQIAAEEVSNAANDLGKLLAEIQIAPRAEKTTISAVVDAAFARLKAARKELKDVEVVLKEHVNEDD